MELFIRTHNVEITEAAKEHIHRRLGFALDRFGNRIRKVRVYLMDLNGPRQGIDKLCQLTILLRGLGRMTVLEKDSTVTSAVSRAARLAQGRIAKKIRRRLGRSTDSIRFSSNSSGNGSEDRAARKGP
jgi:putative sigma-54 modulation protein